jgi:hypothetical protein
MNYDLKDIFYFIMYTLYIFKKVSVYWHIYIYILIMFVDNINIMLINYIFLI